MGKFGSERVKTKAMLMLSCSSLHLCPTSFRINTVEYVGGKCFQRTVFNVADDILIDENLSANGTRAKFDLGRGMESIDRRTFSYDLPLV